MKRLWMRPKSIIYRAEDPLFGTFLGGIELNYDPKLAGMGHYLNWAKVLRNVAYISGKQLGLGIRKPRIKVKLSLI